MVQVRWRTFSRSFFTTDITYSRTIDRSQVGHRGSQNGWISYAWQGRRPSHSWCQASTAARQAWEVSFVLTNTSVDGHATGAVVCSRRPIDDTGRRVVLVRGWAARSTRRVAEFNFEITKWFLSGRRRRCRGHDDGDGQRLGGELAARTGGEMHS